MPRPGALSHKDRQHCTAHNMSTTKHPCGTERVCSDRMEKMGVLNQQCGSVGELFSSGRKTQHGKV